MTDRGLSWTVAHLRVAQSPEDVRHAVAEAASHLTENETLPASTVLSMIEELAVDNAQMRIDLALATRAREVLLANVAHDLRNPLNTFAMSAGLLRDDLESADFDRTRGLNLLARMDRASARMQGLIEDLLEASRIEARAVELAPRREQAAVVARAALAKAKTLIAERGAKLEEGAIDDALAIECDRARLVQAIEKLILVALKSTGEGGAIRLGVETIEDAGAPHADGGNGSASPSRVAFVLRAVAPRGQMGANVIEGAESRTRYAIDESRGGLALLIARGLITMQEGVLALEMTAEGPRILASFKKAS